jgi:hypothetical protein
MGTYANQPLQCIKDFFVSSFRKSVGDLGFFRDLGHPLLGKGYVDDVFGEVDVVLPKVNTLYSLAWLDLSREPIVLHIPNNTGRFFLKEVADAWTNVYPMSPGTRSGTQ